MLRADDLDIDFWVDGNWYPAVDGVTFALDPGEVLAIVGESGFGQVDHRDVPHGPAAGECARLRFDPAGRPAIGRSPGERAPAASAASEIAVIFQEPMTALNPVYTIGFQIGEMLRSH